MPPLKTIKKLQETTTIQLDKSTVKEINSLRHVGESYNDVVKRLLRGAIDVYTEFVLIDNELPQLHTAVFQLGEDSKSLYFWNGQNLAPITVQETQKLMKQPKPNMTISYLEAGILYDELCHHGQAIPNIEGAVELSKRLEKFLENPK